MNTSPQSEDKLLISFADIVLLFRRSKKAIFKWSLALAAYGVVFALLKPIHYEAEGTFREKGVKTNNVSTTSVIQLLSGASLQGAESEAASLMASRRILNSVIDQLHLQGQLTALSDTETAFRRMGGNFKLTWASLFRSSLQGVLPDICCPLKIAALHYTGEIPVSFHFRLLSDGQFEVLDASILKLVGQKGKLGEPFGNDEISFTLAKTQPGDMMISRRYLLTVNTLFNTATDLGKLMKVEPTKLDKSLLKISCKNRNRHMASLIVNTTMQAYQNYLKNYHVEIALNQLDYLNQRRRQLTENLNSAMQRHADFLSDDLSNSGFIDASKEIDFLAVSQHEYKRKMLDNELEIKRLNSINPAHLAYYQRFSANEGDPTFINSILSEMRSLKQQRDALEIEVHQKSVEKGTNLQLSFDQQLNDLKEIQENSRELGHIIERFQQGDDHLDNAKILNDPRFLLRGWLERVQKAKAEGSSNLKEIEANFRDYLNNLARSFGVHERILQERLTHQQNPSGEFKGISLEVATNLYLDYSKQLVQMEGTVRQNLFFIHQMEDPNFEITSLSAGLDDEVSHNMIRKASDLLLNLRDQNNQSPREQERIKDELELQRTFLKLHLKQMVQLMELNKQLIDEKIFALENISLELIHERISLLEKNLQDYLKSRLNNLQQERTLIQRHLDNIHGEMASLPQKWVSEQLLSQEVEINQKIVEEIAKLVESKNISHKLDVIQSAPVDVAIPPIQPMSPKVLLWGALGFILGGMLGSGYVLGKTLRKGIPVTVNNLTLMGFHVSGQLSGDKWEQKSNLETLRRLQTYVDSDAKEAKTVLLLQGKGPHYASELAELFLNRGKKVLILDLDLSDTYKIAIPGLLQYLEGKITHMPIRHGRQGDWIYAGGATRYAVEKLNSPAFSSLLDHFKRQYELILAVSSVPPMSGEAESLLAKFPYAAITLIHETIDDMHAFARFQELHPEHRLTLMLYEDVQDISS